MPTYEELLCSPASAELLTMTVSSYARAEQHLFQRAVWRTVRIIKWVALGILVICHLAYLIYFYRLSSASCETGRPRRESSPMSDSLLCPLFIFLDGQQVCFFIVLKAITSCCTQKCLNKNNAALIHL